MRSARLAVLLLLAVIAAGLSGCGSTPLKHGVSNPASESGRDGPEAHPPANLQSVPDAQPRVENIRQGGPNKPYEVAGESYTPLTGDAPLVERGLASWYGKKFHGHPTASGEIYDMYAMTAAHATMPIPSYARVRNPANGREVIVRINDRGPFHKGRIIDLSYTAALKLGVLNGVAPVEVERITYQDIASGAWQRGQPDEKLPDGPANAPVYAAATPVGAPPPETTAQIAAQDVPADTAPLPPAPRLAASGYWVQLGAFSRLDGAEALRGRVVDSLAAIAPLLAIFKDHGLNRVQAGPYATREDARSAQRQLRAAAGMQSVLVER